ncbi:MAG TPA: hypothetical protein VNO70_04665 [Blastocatellia bacterium]|nr:hypothetical protein [Blastocatellia bacterium]
MANIGRSAHPNALPNYQNAVIPSEKLEKYALSPDHPVGKHKAVVFKSALGFDQSNWQLLEKSILDELPYHDAGSGETGPWGIKYNVVLPITGPNGRTAEVLTVWIIRPGTDYPSLVTTYVQ